MDRYETKEKQTLFTMDDELEPIDDVLFLKNIIEDRKSKYSATCKKITKIEDVKDFFAFINKYKFYKKANHNTYAYRIKLEDGSLLEGKNDDWELGGGNCILSMMRKSKMINCMVVVTRYFGWIQLHSDRFKHLLDATKIILEQSKKTK